MIVLPDFSPTPDTKPSVKNGGRAMRANDAQPIDGAPIDGRFTAPFMQHFMQQVSPNPDVDFDAQVVEDTVGVLEAESDVQASGDLLTDNLLTDNAAAQQLLAMLDPAAGIQLKAGLNNTATATLDETIDADSPAKLPESGVQPLVHSRSNRLSVGDLAPEHIVQAPAPDTGHKPNPSPAAQTETPQPTALLSALKSMATLSGLPSSAEAPQALMPNQALLPAAPSTAFIPSSTAPVPAPATMPLATPFNQPDWGQAMMQQVVQTLANGKQIQHAELQLNPPDLGALQVTLRIEGAHAQAWFASPYAHVREAVHSALPELAQHLQQAGLALDDAQVGSEQRRFAASEQAFAQSDTHSQSRDSSQDSAQSPSQSSTPAGQSGPASIQTHTLRSSGLLRIDTYA